MAFINIGAGLAQMGKDVAQTAGNWTLEAQRADAEKEKLKLIQDFTAGENVKQRDFSKSERIEGQSYQSGEKALDRTQQMDITKMQMENAVKTAQISAGPGYASVAQRQREFDAGAPQRQAELEGKMADTALKQKAVTGYDAEHRALTEQREAQTKSFSAEAILRTIQADSAKNVFEAKKELEAAATSKDPEAMARAREKLAIADYSAKDEVQQVSLAQAQAKLWETAMLNTQTRLASLKDAMTPGAEKLVEQLNKNLEFQRKQFEAAAREADELRRRSQINLSPGTTASASGEPDPAQFLKRKPPAVTGKPQGIVNQPSGMVSP